jgi:hypothetical protein
MLNHDALRMQVRAIAPDLKPQGYSRRSSLPVGRCGIHARASVDLLQLTDNVGYSLKYEWLASNGRSRTLPDVN